MNCVKCKHAVWCRTTAGRLHPSGDGRCEYPWKLPPLPASMYWIFASGPSPHGGHISRKKELEKDCVYFAEVPS